MTSPNMSTKSIVICICFSLTPFLQIARCNNFAVVRIFAIKYIFKILVIFCIKCFSEELFLRTFFNTKTFPEIYVYIYLWYGIESFFVTSYIKGTCTNKILLQELFYSVVVDHVQIQQQPLPPPPSPFFPLVLWLA